MTTINSSEASETETCTGAQDTATIVPNTLAQNIAVVSYVMSAVYVTTAIIGLIGNFFVMFIIARSRYLRQQLHNVLIFNQSVADSWCALFILLGVFKKPDAKLYGLGGELICRIWLSNLFLWIGFVASLYNLVFLSIERYLEIVHPVWHRNFFDRNKLVMIIAFVWLMGVVFQTAAYIPHSGLVQGTCYTMSFWVNYDKQIYGVINFIHKNVIPLAIFAWCYIGMARSLTVRVVPKSTVTVSSENNVYTRARRNIFKTLYHVIIVHVISWSINQILFLAYMFGYPLNFTSLLYQISVAMIYMSTCANPIVYLLKYEKFRKAVKTSFLKVKQRSVTLFTV